MSAIDVVPDVGLAGQVSTLLRDRSGSIAIEYGFIAFVIVVGIAATTYLLGDSVAVLFQSIQEAFP